MDPANEFEEFVHFFMISYSEGGRDKEELIRFLKSYPDASVYLSDEIIEHLENPTKRYLDGKKKVVKELIDYELYNTFLFGPDHVIEFLRNGSKGTNTVWSQKSYDEKIYELSKLFPEYTVSTLKKKLSIIKNQYVTSFPKSG